MPINYKLIYELQDIQTDALSNLITQKRRLAEEQAEKEFKVYTEAIQKALGSDDFEVTNIACVAKGIWHHVYHPSKTVQRGLGKRKCIFCGCDDFDL